MYIKRLAGCREIVAGDGTRLRELLHPERDPVGIRCSLAIARLEPGQSSAPHRLKSSEVYYVIGGVGMMHVDEETEAIGPGDAVSIPAGAIQWLENPGGEAVEFACIVDPAWRQEDEEILRQNGTGPGCPGPA